MGNPALFLAQLNGSLAFQDRAGGGTLTGSGAVRYAPAEGARINYCCNPRLASNTSYWGGNGASGTITRVSDGAFSGGNALEVSATTGGHGSNNSNAGIKVPNPSQSFTISFDAYLVSGASDWIIVASLRDAANGFLAESPFSSVTVTPSVQRFSHTFTPSSVVAGVHTINFKFLRLTTAAGTVRISNVLISPSADTTYFDGSTGGVWLDPITGILGTAHASPSVSQAVAWVEEGTTNTIPDPSFENATITNYWSNGGSATISKVSTHAHSGTYGGKVSCTASTSDGIGMTGTSGPSASSGQTWTVQLRARAFASGDVGKTFVIVIRERDAGYAVVKSNTSAAFTLTDASQLCTYTVTLSGGGTVTNITVAVLNGAASAVDFVLDCVQLEQKAYATSYCDGSLGTGYAWSGTAHASSSTRTAATLYLPWSASLVNTVRGHVALRESPRDNLAINGRGLFIVSRWNLDLDDHISMSYNAATFTGRFETNGSGASMVESLIVANEWKLIWMAWDANSLYMGNGSSQTDTTARAVAAAGTVNAGQPTVYFGADPAGSHHNGYIGPVLIADRPLTASERARLNGRTLWSWGILRRSGRHLKVM